MPTFAELAQMSTYRDTVLRQACLTANGSVLRGPRKQASRGKPLRSATLSAHRIAAWGRKTLYR